MENTTSTRRSQSVSPSLTITIKTASLCEPTNPGGWGCWGFIACAPDGAVITHQAGCLGRQPTMSNNLAAYHAVIEALRWASTHADSARVEILTPVKFIADQVNRIVECNADHLRPLRDEAASLLAQGDFTI